MSVGQRRQLNKTRWMLLVLLAIAVLVVLGVLAYLLLGGPGLSTVAAPPTAKTQLSLPTAPPPTVVSGPPAPVRLIFVPQTPLKGFSSCTYFGFKGKIAVGNGQRLQNVQVVVWSKEQGLLALGDVDAGGNYSVRIAGRPTPRKLWVQIFSDDVPVSEAVTADTHINCENGYQIYQVDWQQVAP